MTFEMLFKKLGLMTVFYFMISIVDTLASSVFSSYTMGFLCGFAVAWVATYALRKAYVQSLNTLQEKRDEYNALALKDKVKRVLKMPQFGLDMVLLILATIVFMLIPRVPMGMSYFFGMFYVTVAHRLLYIPFAIGFVLIDIAVWVLAYRKAYMKKKY